MGLLHVLSFVLKSGWPAEKTSVSPFSWEVVFLQFAGDDLDLKEVDFGGRRTKQQVLRDSCLRLPVHENEGLSAPGAGGIG